MKSKLTILLVIIVVVPLGLLIGLGIKVMQTEQEMIRVRFDELLEARLAGFTVSVEKIMGNRERELIQITDLQSFEADAIREVTREERIVRQLFVVDADGELVHPPKDETMSRSEEAFLTRTQRIFGGKGSLFRPADDRSLKQARTVKNEEKLYGWHVWYWDEGINLFFWRRHDDGRIAGAELSRVVLLSDIVGELPETDYENQILLSDRIQLVDASGRLVYGFGQHQPAEGEKPRVSLALEPPLGSWKLEYFTKKGSLDEAFRQNILFNMFVGLGALGLVIMGLAVYYVRENSRQIRQATERVTFVNQVSHELKTPLTNIRMYAELLDYYLDDEDEKASGYLNVIVSESQRLSRLIGNVLSFGRKQQSRLTVRKTESIVDEVIQRVVEQFEPSLRGKGVEISVDCQAADSVLIDPDVLEQILGNLLSNVEKYAALGKSVSVKSRHEDDWSIVTVTDFGPGIPRTAKEKIFQPFFRYKSMLTDGVTGTGIGLTISRDLARLHGGDLTLEPSETGSCFKVVLHAPRKR